ncbi:MAG: helix-turn-helix domain-containing protein [Bacteroidota bacterium]|nr:helix-turn-helix domain-containing protein [Bacteroidota bacterium]
MKILKGNMSTNLHIKDKSENSLFLKVAPFRKAIRKTEPHKHNSYFEIIYLAAGKGYHSIDNKKYEVRPPVLFFIRHEQVHHWDLDEDTDPDGFVLILKKSLFENSLDGELKLLLTRISKLSCAYLEENEAIHQLFTLLINENAAQNESSLFFMEGILKALFVKIWQLARPVAERTPHQTGLYRAFIELLIHDQPKKNKIAFYAGLLNTTPQNLNAVCRKAAARSAAEVIAEYIIDEARRLLVYSDNTISEISFILSFKDPSHFVKYFKRYTTLTPLAFRAIRR